MSKAETHIQRLASFAERCRLQDIPDQVQAAIVRHLADSLACAIAAAAEPEAPAIDIVRRYAQQSAGKSEASIIGTGERADLRSATLVNSTLVRYLDANDMYVPGPGRMDGSGHFSDALPAVISAAEHTGASGQELLTAAIIAYEVQAALAEAYLWMRRGLHSVSQVTVGVALGAGKLLGLNPEQLGHAASLALTSGLMLQSWLKPATEVPTIKGGAPGFSAERGILCAELAGLGFTGPPDALESLFELLPADAVAEPFMTLGSDWRTTRSAIKRVPAQFFTQPAVECAEDLYRQGLRLDDLAELTVRSNNGACGRVQGSPAAYRPQTREAADHSTPFVVAMALQDGTISPATYANECWLDARIGTAMASVKLIIDPEWDRRMNDLGTFGAELRATDHAGTVYKARVEQFTGHPDKPLSDQLLNAKLAAFVDKDHVQGPDAGKRLFQRCLQLLDGGTVPDLIAALQLNAGPNGTHSAAR